jgi:hypothetical protein
MIKNQGLNQKNPLRLPVAENRCKFNEPSLFNLIYMKKICLPAIIAFLFLFVQPITAQNSFTSDTSFNSQMNLAFAHLEKNRVPYGILLDYGMEFTGLSAYNGLTLADSAKTTYGTVLDIYNTLASSIIHTNAGSFYHPIYIDSLWQSMRAPGVITLGGLFYNYSQFRPDAVSSNLITITANQVYDKYVGAVWQNPYQTQQVFAVSPSTNWYNSNGSYSVQVKFPASLWLSNAGGTVSSIAVDFGDGNGYRTITLDQVLTVSYANGGQKNWIFKLNLTGGGMLQSQTSLKLDSANFVAGNFPKRSHSGLASAETIRKFKYKVYGFQLAPKPVNADNPFFGQKASGFMTIIYANSDMKFHQPLIIAEGFDPGDILTPEQLTGITDFNSFTHAVSDNNASPSLANLVFNGGYDIIYVDWKHGTDFIERNGELLEKVIQMVNMNKAAGASQNVVLGQSMGALIARWALKDMENHGIDHQTRLYLSWDGPHQGANVPIAYQYASRQARTLYINSSIPSLFNAYNNVIRPSINGLINSVNTIVTLFGGSPFSGIQYNNLGDIALGALGLQDVPAAREMLIDYISRGLTLDNSIHAAWQSSLQTMGYPATCTNIAVSNGSECAETESFLPGQAMFDLRGNASTRFLGDVIGTFGVPLLVPLLNQPELFLSVLPGKSTFNLQFTCDAQPDGVAAQQYVGKLSFTKKLLWFDVTVYITNWSVVSNASILPYDYFPGGEYPLPINISSAQYTGPLIKFGLTVLANQPSFDFVPIPSALDIGKGSVTLAKADYLVPYVGAFPPVAPKNTPFTSFTTAYNASSNTAPNNNEQHIQISRRNGDWVANQLNGTPAPSNCSFMCSNILSITGPASVCTSAPYSVQILNASPNTAINWSVLPVMATISPVNTAQVTVTKTSNGSTNLSVSVGDNSGACGTPIVITKPIKVGAQTPTSISGFAVDGVSFWGNNVYTFSSTGTQWSVLHGTITHGQGTNTITVTTNAGRTNGTNLSFQVSVEENDACGVSAFLTRSGWILPGTGPAPQSALSPDSSNLVPAAIGSFPNQAALSPNPANNRIYVSSANLADETGSNTSFIKQVIIYDLAGKRVKTVLFDGRSNGEEINVGDLLAGTYFVNIFYGQSSRIEKLIILH